MIDWIAKWWSLVFGAVLLAVGMITFRSRAQMLTGAARGKVDALRKKIDDARAVRERLVQEVGSRDAAVATLDGEIDKNQRDILAQHNEIALGMGRHEIRERLRKLGYE